MDVETIGRKARRALMRGASMHPISTWEYGATSVLADTVFSNGKTLAAAVVVIMIGTVSILLILLRRKRLRTKDTLCVFVYMVVSIFLLESVQRMKKIDLSLEENVYADLDVEVPENAFFVTVLLQTLGKRERCKGSLDKKLEEKIEEVQMGRRAAEAYRDVIKRRAKKAGSKKSAVIVDKETGEVLGETTLGDVAALSKVDVSLKDEAPPTRKALARARALAPARQMQMEYCIMKKTPSTGEPREGCIFLENPEFEEAREEYMLIKKASGKYNAQRRKLDLERRGYRNTAISLMKHFKVFAKIGTLFKRELFEMNISLVQMERDVSEIVHKFDSLFAGEEIGSKLRIDIGANSICVKSQDRRSPLEKPMGQGAPGRVIGPDLRRRLVGREMSLGIVSPLGVADTSVQEQATDIGIGNRGANSEEVLLKTVEKTKKVKTLDQEGIQPSFPDMFGLKIKSALALDHHSPEIDDILYPGPSRKSENPLVLSMYRTISVTEILLFLQVFIVFGVISALVFDFRGITTLLYVAMAASLLVSVILGMYAFAQANSLSSLCRKGLGCHKRGPAWMPSGDSAGDPQLQNSPFSALRDSIHSAERELKKQIYRIISEDPLPEIETALEKISHLEHMRDDFTGLLVGNVNRDLISKDALYHSIDGMKASLGALKSTNKRLRESRIMDTYRDLAQMEVLLSNSSNTYLFKTKRNIVKNASGEAARLSNSTCEGKERTVCALKDRFDSLFLGLGLTSTVLIALLAI